MLEIHLSPGEGSGLMPCCGRTPFEVPETDRVTLSVERATCRGVRAPGCKCEPRCTVQGVAWAYDRELGWHDPAEHQPQLEAPCTPS